MDRPTARTGPVRRRRRGSVPPTRPAGHFGPRGSGRPVTCPRRPCRLRRPRRQPRPVRRGLPMRGAHRHRGPLPVRAPVTWRGRRSGGRPKRRGSPVPVGRARKPPVLPIPIPIPMAVTAVTVVVARVPLCAGGRPRAGVHRTPTRPPPRRARRAGRTVRRGPTPRPLRGVGVTPVTRPVRRQAMDAGRVRRPRPEPMKPARPTTATRTSRQTVPTPTVAGGRLEAPGRRSPRPGRPHRSPRTRIRPCRHARVTSPARRCAPHGMRRSGRGRPGAMNGTPQQGWCVRELNRSGMRGRGPA